MDEVEFNMSTMRYLEGLFAKHDAAQKKGFEESQEKLLAKISELEKIV